MRFRKFAPILALVSTLVCHASSARAQASAKLENGLIVIQNESLRIAIDPQVGGRVVQYVFKPFGDANLVYPTESNGGMLMDMFWQQSWPGDLLMHPYQYEIVNPGPDEAVVRVWRVAAGMQHGNVVEDLAGLNVQRTISLRAGDRALRVRVSLRNDTTKNKLPGYWMQNNFYLLGHKEANQWYRPTMYGVDLISTQKSSPYYSYFVDAPTAGWVGVANKDLHGGLMFLMDYNDLGRLYDNMGAVTTEWMYDRVSIPPGKSWETEVAVIPTPGLDAYSFGARSLVAELRIDPQPGSVHVTHKLTAGINGLKDVTVSTHAEGARGDWKTAPVTQKAPDITDAVTTLETQIPGAGPAPMVVKVSVTGTTPKGETVTYDYGNYEGGSAGKNIDLVTLHPLYAFPRPPRKQVILKPATIVKTHNDHLRVLFVRGLWHQYSGLDEALKQIPGAEVVDSWYAQSDIGVSLQGFPFDYETLMGYDVVVLADIDDGGLGNLGEEMLADFVDAGGGLLVIGGDRTYGQAGFDNSRFLKMLPVDVKGPFDWHKLPHPEPLIVSDSVMIPDVHFDAATVVLYQHWLNPSEGANVLVRAGDRPALLTKQTGKGKVAASLLLPFGQPVAGSTGYWQSPQWFDTMRHTIQWLAAP